MAVQYEIPVPLTFGGLDFGESGLAANPNNARSLRNVRRLASGDLTDREGSKVIASNSIGTAFGTFCYKKTDPTTFIETKQILIAASKLYKKVEHLIHITYAGAGQAIAQCLIDETTGEWKFSLFVGSTEVLAYDLGIGFDETTPITTSNLLTAINAVTDFVATAASISVTIPAAFIESLPPASFAAGSPQTIDISVFERKVINQPTGAADPFAGTAANKNASNFENVCAIEDAGNIYFASKYDEQKKYDGNDVYRSGAPVTELVSVVAAGAGALAAGTYKYIQTIVQVDQNGLEVESDESALVSITNGGATNNNVTARNVLAASGFNTDCAIVNGAQVAVRTINVDNGTGGQPHTMKVGQKAYFNDSISGGYVTRTLTAVAANTITFGVSEAAVTVADNAVISNNLKIRLRRTVTTGSIFKQLVDLPNNSFTANTVYNDGIADSALGLEYTSPSELGVNHGLPPKCAYLAKYNGRPVSLALSGDVSAFSWASVQGPEYYPDNYTDIVSGDSNSAITGGKAGDRYLWIHQSVESFLVTGSLFDGTYSIDKKGDKVGCGAHASIADTDMGMVWYGDGGYYGSVDGATPIRISGPIEPIFTNTPLTDSRKLKFKRSVALWDSKNKLYVCFVPAEDEQGGEVYANSNSITLAYDMRLKADGSGQVRGDWYEWNNINMAGGACYVEEEEQAFWTERHYSSFDGATISKTWQRLFTNSIYDMVDHNLPILWKYEPNWFHGGQPTVDKKFISIALFSFNTEINAYGVVNIRTERNLAEGNAHSRLVQNFGIGSQSQGWGFGAWGFFPWGNPSNSRMKPRRLKNGSAQTFRACFSGGAIYTKMLLSGYSLLVGSPFKIDMKGAHPNG